VRAVVLDFELLSHLHVTRHNDTYQDTSTNTQKNNIDSITLWHMDVNHPAGQPTPAPVVWRRVASLVRPTDAIFASQMALVEAHADLREDRASEVLAQLGPPTAFWSSIVYLHPDRRRWTLELLDMALRLANFVEHRLKQAHASRRPIEHSPQIQPIILTPGHSAFPSGHGTEAFMIAYILWRLQTTVAPAKNVLWLEELMRQAARVAINRTVAGVHFPVDSAAGQLLGLTLGDYFIRRCGIGGGNFNAWRFDGERFTMPPPNNDFDWRLLYDAVNDARLSAQFTDQIAGAPAPQTSPLLQWLWGKAVAEWP
jgi:hypothetical protein